MRRSSKVALLVAVLILVAMIVVYLKTLDTVAPPMSLQVAQQLLERGRVALERRDADGIMDLMASNAKILDQNVERMRLILYRTMRELGTSHLTATWKNLNARQQGNNAYVSFDLEVGQDEAGVWASYYRPHINLELTKVRVSRWFGLYTTEEWKITRVESSEPLDIPDL